MKGWKECPDCWGTGLVGGFQAPCDRREFSVNIERWDRKEEQKRNNEFLNSDLGKTLVRLIARVLIRQAIERYMLNDTTLAERMKGYRFFGCTTQEWSRK